MVVVWVPYYCCVLFVVAVEVAVVLFSLVSIYVCLRVLVCSVIVEARRSVTRAVMPPTGANIAVLLLKTRLAPGPTYT